MKTYKVVKNVEVHFKGKVLYQGNEIKVDDNDIESLAPLIRNGIIVEKSKIESLMKNSKKIEEESSQKKDNIKSSSQDNQEEVLNIDKDTVEDKIEEEKEEIDDDFLS